MTLKSTEQSQIRVYQALLAGACAGMSVDVALYPLDTIKTRLQSSEGFIASGGFKGVYSGISSVLLGAAPGAAVFFLSYETAKKYTRELLPIENRSKYLVLSHMLSASLAEVGACLVRVPTERIKQNMQTGKFLSLYDALHNIRGARGLGGFYRGYFATMGREIPFSLIQFPLYEYLKVQLHSRLKREPSAYEIAVLCGSLSGAIAAAMTTPLDVIKTRTMLSGLSSKAGTNGSPNTTEIVKAIYRESGIKGFYKGIGPRMVWISLGGCVFLGVYEQVSRRLQRL